MNRSSLQTALLVAAAGLLLSACGNDISGDSSTPTVTPTSQTVTQLSASSSESGEPFPINDGAFAFNDSNETRDPLAINR